MAYPDQWYEDCVSSYANCETLVEAVHRNNRNIASVFMDSNGAVLSSDLTLCNAMYMPAFNCVVIYPALMMPPTTPDDRPQQPPLPPSRTPHEDLLARLRRL